MYVFLFFLFFRHQAIDVLFLQCQFTPSLSFWLPSNGPKDLIGQGCGHLDSDSQLVNEFCLYANHRGRELKSSYYSDELTVYD